MPTGGKIIAALTFAALAYFISDLIKPLLVDTEGTRVGLLSPINALVGFVMGWKVMGKGAGHTYRQAFGYGLTTLAATAFWCLMVWAGYKMLIASMALRYDGPIHALQGMADTFLEFGRLVAVNEVMIPAVVGALFMAWVTEYFARRWS
ncbi:MAG: TrgA family protein [Pseudomonadota bacterium]